MKCKTTRVCSDAKKEANFRVSYMLCIGLCLLAVKPDNASAASPIEEPENVRQSLGALKERIQDQSCPKKMAQFSSEVQVLLKKEQEVQRVLGSMNKNLREVKRGMYARLAEQKEPCGATTAKSLLQITDNASAIEVKAFLNQSEALLACVDAGIIKLDRRIGKANSNGNSMLLMRLDQAKGKLANIRSDTTALSQKYSVHENKRKRLEKDARDTARECEVDIFAD